MKKSKSKIDYNEEEKDLLDSFEKGEWKSVKNFEQDRMKAKHAAINYLKKDARINIRISEIDLSKIKQKAAYEGIPYQTLIASILHKFAAGHLKNSSSD